MDDFYEDLANKAKPNFDKIKAAELAAAEAAHRLNLAKFRFWEQFGKSLEIGIERLNNRFSEKVIVCPQLDIFDNEEGITATDSPGSAFSVQARILGKPRRTETVEFDAQTFRISWTENIPAFATPPAPKILNLVLDGSEAVAVLYSERLDPNALARLILTEVCNV